MPRRAAFSTHFVARIRAWFGLQQDELALFLGISPSLVRGLESGRRALSATVQPPVLQLLRLLPPPETEVPAAPADLPPGTPTPQATELDFRRRVCLQQAARMETEAGQLARRAHAAHHWAQALPALLAAPTDALALAPGSPEARDRAAWQADWLHRRAQPLPAEDVTRWHLLQARAHALRAEAEALAALLARPA